MKLHVKIIEATVHPERLLPAIRAALAESAALLEKEIRQRTPQGVGGTQSGLRGSMFGEIQESPFAVWAMVGSSLPYGIVVEFGRTPGKAMPPIAALLPWVKLKFGIADESEAKGMAFAVARNIAKEGTLGRFMFYQGATAALSRIVAIFELHVGQVSASLITND